MESATAMADEPEPKPPPESSWTIVLENLGLVYRLARRFCYNRTDYDDAVQEGLLGLLEAARRFEPARQVAFSTYAYPWVLNRVMALFQDRDHFVPNEPPSDNGNDPEHQGDEEWCEPTERALESHEIEYIRQDLRRHIREHLISDLDEFERLILAMRWLAPEPATLKEIAIALGMSPTSHGDVLKMEQNALAKLRMGLSRRRK